MTEAVHSRLGHIDQPIEIYGGGRAPHIAQAGQELERLSPRVFDRLSQQRSVSPLKIAYSGN